MEIRTVRFGAFKSLYDVACDFDHITVMTGPNGSGKSNLVDGLSFLSDTYQHGLEFAVSRAGGFENIAHRRTRRAKKPLSFVVEVRIDRADLNESGLFFGSPPNKDLVDRAPKDWHAIYRHSFALKTAAQSIRANYLVVEDTVEIIDRHGEIAFRVERKGEELLTWATDEDTDDGAIIRDMVKLFIDDRYRDFTQGRLRASALLVENVYYPGLFWGVRETLGSMKVFQLSPYQCRVAGVPTPNAALERHGENLPGAADFLKRNDPKGWAEVEAAMRSILPDLVSVDVAYTEDRRLALQFKERHIGRPWNTGEVSDGTIQALALFIALFDSRIPLLVIEEPENSVHPWILRHFIDLCTQKARKQLVLTSHSPVLLNYVSPSIVRLASLHDGRTEINRLVDLAPEFAEIVLSGEVSLFDAYDSGAIQQGVPRGFSPSLAPNE